MQRAILFVLLATVALVVAPALEAAAQCPPGLVWRQGRCVPAPPPPPPPPYYPPPPPPPPQPPVVMPQGMKTVIAGTLNLRTCPGRRCPVAAVVYRGQALRVEGFERGYFYVRVPGSNITGWASARFLSP